MRRSILVAALLGALPLGTAQAQHPPTPVHLVVDTLHGTPVADPYRWLEASDSKEVQEWFRSQGTYARSKLDALPGRAALLERIRAIGAAAPPYVSLPREAGGHSFYNVLRPGDEVARGYVRDGWTGEERLLVDPALVGGSGDQGANTLTIFQPSPDGRLVLYGVTSGGSESAVLRVREVATGRDLDEPIQRNRWGRAAWLPDGRSFLYVQLHDLPADAPRTDLFRDVRIFRHRMGEGMAADAVVFSAATVGLDSMLLPMIRLDASNGLAFGTLESGVEKHSSFFFAPLADVERGTPTWRPLFTLADSVLSIAARGTDLYILTLKGAPMGRVVRTSLAAPDLGTAEVVLPEGARSLEAMEPALDGLYVRAFAEGIYGVQRIPWGGSPAPVPLLPETSIGQMRADPLRPGILLKLDSWTSQGVSYRYNPSADALEDLRLRPLGPDDRLEGYLAETVFVPSHDGVRVPLTIVRPREMVRDGSTPVIMEGYGGYGITNTPYYFAELRAWHDAGGAAATCHVRGGGYYGVPWHQAGQKKTKPNSWLDFIACAEYLVREGYTRPERLAAEGGSAGGILVGRAITERPDLFAVAVIHVGAMDAVRNETTPGGPANVPELGSVATEEGFRALLAMSPLHHVRSGTKYPAVLLTTGLNDPRVSPWSPGKMAAALQAASTSGRPVLLRVDEEEGHGVSSEEQWRQYLADMLAFVMAGTGMPSARPPAKASNR